MILVTVCGTLGRNPPKRTGGGKGYKMRKLPSAVLDDEASEVIFNDPWWREATRLRHTLTLPLRGRREATIVHCQIRFDLDQCFKVLNVCILFGLLRRDPGLGAKRWQQPLTIGILLKSASNGRAKPLMRPCASNTPALVEFGLSRLRGLSDPAQSRRQIQK